MNWAQVKGFAGSWNDIGISISLYSFVPIDIYSVFLHAGYNFLRPEEFPTHAKNDEYGY
jgi:hypothetical protein